MTFSEVLKTAWADVTVAGLPEHIQEEAFRQAVGHHMGLGQDQGARAITTSSPVAGSPNSAALAGRRGDILATVIAESQLPQDWVQDFFYLDDDGAPHVNLPARRLGANTAERTRTIAVALCAVRHFGLDELEFSLDPVREECISLNAYDANNFTAHLSKARGLTLSGPRGKKALRAKTDLGQEFAAVLGSVFGAKAAE